MNEKNVQTKAASGQAGNGKAASTRTPAEKTKLQTTQKLLIYPDFYAPVLRLSPYTWAKLLFLRDYAPCEVGGFGISDPEDLCYIQDLVLVGQDVSGVSVAFHDDAVADFFEDQVDLGRQPEQFARVWIHTHPGNCPAPSGTDKETFHRVFGQTHWAVMAIMAQDDSTYAELRYHLGPKASLKIPMRVDYSKPFPASDRDAWKQEYEQKVSSAAYYSSASPSRQTSRSYDPRQTDLQPPQAWKDTWREYVDEYEDGFHRHRRYDDYEDGFRDGYDEAESYYLKLEEDLDECEAITRGGETAR